MSVAQTIRTELRNLPRGPALRDLALRRARSARRR